MGCWRGWGRKRGWWCWFDGGCVQPSERAREKGGGKGDGGQCSALLLFLCVFLLVGRQSFDSVFILGRVERERCLMVEKRTGANRKARDTVVVGETNDKLRRGGANFRGRRVWPLSPQK